MVLWFLLAAIEFRLHGVAGDNLNASLQMTLATFFTYRVLVLIVLRRSRWIAWLRWKPLLFFGEISYGLYRYPGVMLERMTRALGPVDASKVIPRLALGLAASVAVSYASLRYVELPVRKLRKYVLELRVAPVPR
jgi:peptidoglycan/LPS O-acetylase OafA/YrhL